MFGWTGGDLIPICVSWASRSQWCAAVMRAVSWTNAGQSLGMIDAMPPALADGVLAVRHEWSAIEAERAAEARRKAVSNGVR